MTSIKVKFRPSAVEERPGSIYYQIIHQQNVRRIHTELRIYANEWNRRQSVVSSSRNGVRREALRLIKTRIDRDIRRLSLIINRLDNSMKVYSSDEIVDEFNRYLEEGSLLKFTKAVIEIMKQNGRIRTAETYAAATNSFIKFNNGRDIPLDEFSSELMEKYQSYLTGNGLSPNSISFYMRILRALYNKAADKGIIEPGHPFRHVYTGIEKTVKRAIPLRIIRKIKSLDLSHRPAVDFARDIFLLSFYFRGMSVIDMAFLKKNDLKNGYLTYRRRKTDRRLTIKWTSDMQRIVDKYPCDKTDFLLPIIKKDSVNQIYAYRNMANNINRNLKKIGEMVGTATPLTLYVARHSWASAARNKGISMSIISEGMGHDSEMTTRIYLASLDSAAIDRANARIINML